MVFHFRNLWEIYRNPYLWTNETETDMGIERFSYYRPPISQAVVPSENKTLEEVFRIITTDPTLEDNTRRLRDSLLTDGEDKYREEKKRLLPSVTFGGVFDYRHRDPQKYRDSLLEKRKTETDPQEISKIERNISLLEGKKGLLSPSGLVIIDIDHISQTGVSLEGLRERLSGDREIGVRLVFVSPSGDGLKLVCKTASGIETLSQYEDIYNRLRNYINTAYPGIVVDKSGKDITRLCLLPFDSQAILRDWEDTFHPERHPLPSTKVIFPRDFERLPDLGDGVEEIVRRVEESGRDIAPDYSQYLPLVYSFTALGERGRSLLHRVCRFSPKYNPEDTDRDWDKCIDSPETQSIGYFINLCKDSGIDVSFPHRERSRYAEMNNPDRYTTRGGISPQTDRETPQQTSQERYSGYLDIPDIREEVSKKKEGIKTGYSFRNSRGKEEKLILSPGLTFICGKSSHGKSRFIQNLSLQILQELQRKEEEGVVLFFAFEEDYPEVILQFANIYTRTPGISKFESTSNTEVLRDYFKTGSLNKSPDVSPNKTQEENRQIRLRREEIISSIERFREIQTSGRLRVYYSPDLQVRGDRTPLDKEDLSGVLEYLSSKLRVKAVFLDYVQAIYKDGYRGDRKDELREICSELNKLSKRLDIPFVLSAQLNRETSNPTSMSGDNIAESADITRYSDTILCLWNSAFINDVKNKDSYLESKDYKLLQSRGFTLGEEGKLYCILTKNRGATPYIDAVLDFVGETGEIPTNEDLPPDTAPQTGRQKGTDGLFSGEYEEL